jgi:hypothetical protein
MAASSTPGRVFRQERDRYGWSEAARALEGFYRQILKNAP